MLSGLYIVALKNEEGISVNANDHRIADRCIKVTRDNCKFGKARNLSARRRNYEKVFGAHNVDFRPIVEIDEIEPAERLVLAKLRDWRVRGTSGRLNEWQVGISPTEVERIAVDALRESGLSFKHLGSSRD